MLTLYHAILTTAVIRSSVLFDEPTFAIMSCVMHHYSRPHDLDQIKVRWVGGSYWESVELAGMFYHLHLLVVLFALLIPNTGPAQSKKD